MIANFFYSVVTALFNQVAAAVHGAFAGIDTGSVQAGWTFFQGLDNWVPVTDVILMLGIIATTAVVMAVVKLIVAAIP